MCGIAGLYSSNGQPLDRTLVIRMTEAQRHRGPDDEGYLAGHIPTGAAVTLRGDETIPELRTPHINDGTSIPFEPDLLFGWRRLSIIDPSSAGHQPMKIPGVPLWIIFNGEIYNYVELREELRSKGRTFHTESDTEVLLHAFHEWGPGCVNRFNGMWGFAVWNTSSRKLFCSRDRYGIKPFYYSWNGSTFAFASEIKALLKLPWITPRANDPVVYDYLLHRMTDHTDQTFFRGIHQLEPGTSLVVDANGPVRQKYYVLAESPAFGRFNEKQCRQYAEELRVTLSDAVRLHLRSDVPVGSCLSGGLDSSSLVCLANSLLLSGNSSDARSIGERQKTFTATSDDPRYSEDAYVRLVIAATRAESHHVTPTAGSLFDEAARFIRAHDEPVISTSMYAQWNVMRLASNHGIKVLLDGQGGDELLGGYRWYYPIFLADLISRGRFFGAARELTAASRISGESAASLGVKSIRKLIKRSIPNSTLRGMSPLAPYLETEFRSAFGGPLVPEGARDRDFSERLRQDLTSTNLRQLLRYEDRNSMAFSIEARVPFLDYRVVELVSNVPAVYKIRDGWSKYLLRRAMQNILPGEIQWRRDKMGFVTPEQDWLSSLLPDLRRVLSANELRSVRFVDPSSLQASLAGQSRNLQSSDLWRLINLELWMHTFEVS